jgi:alpha-glucosidase
VRRLEWWQKAVFYQIYPRSFADGNGDGVGDFAGMTRRLDYLQDLGIDAIWLSPFYPSPQCDCGYDVSNYTDVAPEYGTLSDFRDFVSQAHQRNIRVIIDFVINHTSHEHPWFAESRSGRGNPKRDWYIWKDGRGGAPPNGWFSCFGGPAWELDRLTQQYYYHYFLKQQPDLNWRNPEVRRAMFDVVRFWLDLGVDGFRIDAPGTLFEDADLRESSQARSQAELYLALHQARTSEERLRASEALESLYERQVERPEVHEVMQGLRALVDTYGDGVLVGEVDDPSYHGNGTDELQLVFNFPLMRAESLRPAQIRANQSERLSRLPPGAWPCNTLGNHDSSRVWSHFADGRHDAELARLSLALMLTLRGTPFLYYGEEIGMTDLLLTDASGFRDYLSKWLYQQEIEVLGSSPAEALRNAAMLGRDKCRTPMQWSTLANAGFSPSGARTWLPVNPNFAHGVNVEGQLAVSGSMLEFYRALLRLRRSSYALTAGSWQVLAADQADCLAFLRKVDDQDLLVVLNWSDRPQLLHLNLEGARLTAPPRPSDATADRPAVASRVLFSTHRQQGHGAGLDELRIAPFEVLIAEVDLPPHRPARQEE